MKDSITFRGPRSKLNNFPLAKPLKFEELFPQNSAVLERSKETIEWTYNEEQLSAITVNCTKLHLYLLRKSIYR